MYPQYFTIIAQFLNKREDFTSADVKKTKTSKKTLPSTKLPLESKHILGFPFPRSIRFT